MNVGPSSPVLTGGPQDAPVAPADRSESGPAELVVSLVTYNSGRFFGHCIDTLRAGLRNVRARVVIVDNASRGGPPVKPQDLAPDFTLIENVANVGFGRANNQVADAFPAEFLLLLNTDAFVAPEAVNRALAFMREHPECGVLGARLIDPAGAPQFSARPFPTVLRAFAARAGLGSLVRLWAAQDRAVLPGGSAVECDWVPGCFYMIRRKVIETVGLFDPRFFLYYEEVDHCRRVRSAGWKVVCLPSIEVVHIGGASAESEGSLSWGGRQIPALQLESEILYFRKHFGLAILMSHVVLQGAADPIRLLVNALRLRRTHHFADGLRSTALMFRLLAATRLGTRPTR